MTHDRLTTLYGNHPSSDCVQHAGLLRSMDRRTAMDNAVTSRLDETEHSASPWRVSRDVPGAATARWKDLPPTGIGLAGTCGDPADPLTSRRRKLIRSRGNGSRQQDEHLCVVPWPSVHHDADVHLEVYRNRRTSMGRSALRRCPIAAVRCADAPSHAGRASRSLWPWCRAALRPPGASGR